MLKKLSFHLSTEASSPTSLVLGVVSVFGVRANGLKIRYDTPSASTRCLLVRFDLMSL
jgi:hypothetical protein